MSIASPHLLAEIAIDALKKNPPKRNTNDVAAIKRFLLTTTFLASQFNDDGSNFEQISKLLRLEIHAANSEVFRAGSYGDKYYLILRGSVEINAPSKKLINRKSFNIKDDQRLKLLLKQRASTIELSQYLLPSTSMNNLLDSSVIEQAVPCRETNQLTENQKELHLKKQPQLHEKQQQQKNTIDNPIRIVIKPSQDCAETTEQNRQSRIPTPQKDRIEGFYGEDLNSNELSQQTIQSRRFNQFQKYEKHYLNSQEGEETETQSKIPATTTTTTTTAKVILQAGEEFGESAMISSYPRSFTAKTVQSTSATSTFSEPDQLNAVLLAVLTKHQFSQVLRRSQLRNLHAELEILRSSYVLRTWTDHMIKDLFLSSQVLNISSEQCVYKQFDTADSIFIILKDETINIHASVQSNQYFCSNPLLIGKSFLHIRSSSKNIKRLLINGEKTSFFMAYYQMYPCDKQIGQMTMSDVFGEEEFKEWIQDAISMPFTKDELETVLYKPQSDSTAIAQHLQEHFQISKQLQQQQQFQPSATSTHSLIDSAPPSKVVRDSSVVCKNREGGIVLKIHILDFLKRLVIFTNNHKTMVSQIEAKRVLHAKTALRISSTFPLCSDYLKSTQSEVLSQESPKEQLSKQQQQKQLSTTTHTSISPKNRTQLLTTNQSQSNYKDISKEPYILYRNKSTHIIAAQQKQKSQSTSSSFHNTKNNFNTLDQSQLQSNNNTSTNQLRTVNHNSSSHFKKLNQYLNSYSSIGSTASSSSRTNHSNNNNNKKKKVKIINSVQQLHADSISGNSTIQIQNDEGTFEHRQLQQNAQNKKQLSNTLSPPRHHLSTVKSSQITSYPKNQIPFEADSDNLNQSHEQKQLSEPINRILLKRRGSSNHHNNKDSARIASKSRTVAHQRNLQILSEKSSSIPNSSTTVVTSNQVSINEKEPNQMQQLQFNTLPNEQQQQQQQLFLQSKQVRNIDMVFQKKVNKLGYSIVDTRITDGDYGNMIFKNNHTKQLISKMQFNRKYNLVEPSYQDLNERKEITDEQSSFMNTCNQTSNSKQAFPKRKMSFDSMANSEMMCSRRGFKGHLTKRPQSQQSECRNYTYNRLKDSNAMLCQEPSTIFEPNRTQQMCIGIAPKKSTRVKVMNLSRSPSPEKRELSSKGNTSVLATATAVVADVKSTQMVVRKVKQPQLICKILTQYFDNKSFI